MGKTLFWIAVFFGVLLVSRYLSHQAAKKRFRGEQDAQAFQNNPLPGAHCNVYLTRSEALLSQGETWCGEAHAQLGPRQSR